MAGRKLTPQQRRFVEEYLFDLNAAQAAIRAGYAEGSARTTASRLLTNDNIQQAITAAQAARSRRTEIDQDRVLRELAITAFSSVWDYQIDDEGRLVLAEGAALESIRAVASLRRKIRHVGVVPVVVDGKQEFRPLLEYETEVRLWPKVQALKLAGLHLGLFKERTPLEELLAALPPQLAAQLRQALAALMAGGAGEASGQPAQLPSPGQPGGGPGPGNGSGAGHETRPVADSGAAEPGAADPVPLFPIGGEESGGGSDRPG